MDEVKATFDDFIETINDQTQIFVTSIDDFLVQKGCKRQIKPAKSGSTVSYIINNKTLATFVSRKTGIKMRILPQKISDYPDFLNTLPEKMKVEIKKSSDCKRLIDPAACNSKCVKGFEFYIDGEHLKKCRYMAFMPTVDAVSYQFIKTFLEKEL